MDLDLGETKRSLNTDLSVHWVYVEMRVLKCMLK